MNRKKEKKPQAPIVTIREYKKPLEFVFKLSDYKTIEDIRWLTPVPPSNPCPSG